jgi:hypothetical protein
MQSAYYTYLAQDPPSNLTPLYEKIAQTNVNLLHSYGIAVTLIGDRLNIPVDTYIPATRNKKFKYFAESKLMALQEMTDEDFLIDLDLLLIRPPKFERNSIAKFEKPNLQQYSNQCNQKILHTTPWIQYNTGFINLDKESREEYSKQLEEAYQKSTNTRDSIFFEQHILPQIVQCSELESKFVHFAGGMKNALKHHIFKYLERFTPETATSYLKDTHLFNVFGCFSKL